MPAPSILRPRERAGTIYAHAGEDSVPHEPRGSQIDDLVRSRLDLNPGGFIHRDHQLEDLAALLEREGRSDQAERIRALRTTPAGTAVY